MPAVLNNIVGTRIKIVYGYPDGRGINLAMERGEIEGRATNPWSSYISTDPQYVDNKLIVPIIQIGMQKEAYLPDVPATSSTRRSRYASGCDVGSSPRTPRRFPASRAGTSSSAGAQGVGVGGTQARASGARQSSSPGTRLGIPVARSKFQSRGRIVFADQEFCLGHTRSITLDRRRLFDLPCACRPGVPCFTKSARRRGSTVKREPGPDWGKGSE
jgi:hypothetical protein